MNDITAKLYEMLDESSNSVKFKSGENIIEEGHQSNQLYYIKKGLIRGWTNYEGKEITFQFLSEQNFFCCIDSFWFQKNAMYSVSALEDVELSTIHSTELKKMIQRDNELDCSSGFWLPLIP